MAGEEIKVLLTADAAQLQAGMEQGAASVQQSVSQMQATVAEEAAAFNATVQAKIDAMMRLNAAFSGSITSTEGLAEAESALDQAMSAGALTATEYAARTADLDAAELSMAASTDAATAAIEANTVAQEVNAVSSRTSYELGVLLSEAASGNFSRMKRSAAALGNSTGVLSKVFTPAGLAITGLAAAVGVFTYEVFKGEEQSNLFNRALLNSGGVIGVTEGQFVDMAQSITSMDTTIGVAREAMLKFAQSGKVGGEQLQIAGKAAVDFSALTGESMDKSVAAILKLEDKPTKAIVALNEQYHFLSAAQFEHIAQLETEGHKTEAAAEAIKAFQQVSTERLQIADQNVGTLVGWWRDLKGAVSDAADEVQNFGRKQSTQEEIDRLKKQIADVKAGYVTLGDHVDVYNPFHPMIADTSLLEEKLAALQKTERDSRVNAGEKASAQKAQDQTISDIAAQDTFNKSLKETSHLHDAIAQAKARAESIHKNDPGSQSIKGISFDSSGAVAGGEQWAATIAKLTKEYGEHLTPAVKQSGAEARKAASEAMNALEMQRSGTASNTSERIQADAAILANATQMYGAYSSQQKSALDRMLADEKAFSSAYIKDQEDMEKKLEADHAKYVAEVDKASKAAAKKAADTWHQYLDPIDNAFQASINGMIQGTQTLRQMTAHILQSITASYLQEGLKDLENYIINQEAKTAATAAGASARAAIEQTASKASKEADAATGKSQITSAAATGAAKAYQAIVGIPYVGPILAPIAAGVAFAGIEAFSGMISSAQGGWERVPVDGMMTQLHKDEMVLPKHVADPIRQMASGGGHGGGSQVHIHALDGPSVKEMFRRNPGLIADALKHANKRGHFAGAMR